MDSQSGAQQLDGVDPASCGKTNSRCYLRAGRAAHLEAVRRTRSITDECLWSIPDRGLWRLSPRRCRDTLHGRSAGTAPPAHRLPRRSFLDRCLSLDARLMEIRRDGTWLDGILVAVFIFGPVVAL